jgi:hypothetical protein
MPIVEIEYDAEKMIRWVRAQALTGEFCAATRRFGGKNPKDGDIVIQAIGEPNADATGIWAFRSAQSYMQRVNKWTTNALENKPASRLTTQCGAVIPIGVSATTVGDLKAAGALGPKGDLVFHGIPVEFTIAGEFTFTATPNPAAPTDATKAFLSTNFAINLTYKNNPDIPGLTAAQNKIVRDQLAGFSFSSWVPLQFLTDNTFGTGLTVVNAGVVVRSLGHAGDTPSIAVRIELARLDQPYNTVADWDAFYNGEFSMDDALPASSQTRLLIDHDLLSPIITYRVKETFEQRYEEAKKKGESPDIVQNTPAAVSFSAGSAVEGDPAGRSLQNVHIAFIATAPEACWCATDVVAELTAGLIDDLTHGEKPSGPKKSPVTFGVTVDATLSLTSAGMPAFGGHIKADPSGITCCELTADAAALTIGSVANYFIAVTGSGASPLPVFHARWLGFYGLLNGLLFLSASVPIMEKEEVKGMGKGISVLSTSLGTVCTPSKIDGGDADFSCASFLSLTAPGVPTVNTGIFARPNAVEIAGNFKDPPVQARLTTTKMVGRVEWDNICSKDRKPAYSSEMSFSSGVQTHTVCSVEVFGDHADYVRGLLQVDAEGYAMSEHQLDWVLGHSALVGIHSWSLRLSVTYDALIAEAKKGTGFFGLEAKAYYEWKTYVLITTTAGARVLQISFPALTVLKLKALAKQPIPPREVCQKELTMPTGRFKTPDPRRGVDMSTPVSPISAISPAGLLRAGVAGSADRPGAEAANVKLAADNGTIRTGGPGLVLALRRSGG